MECPIRQIDGIKDFLITIIFLCYIIDSDLIHLQTSICSKPIVFSVLLLSE